MILETKNLTYVYGVGTPFEHVALDRVNLSVEKGEFFGIIGHTGSGKSTLIQHLNGLLRPSSGQVLLAGQDIWAKPDEIKKIRFRVGLVFQYPEYQLFEETVEEDIAFGPKNQGLNEQQIHERVKEAAEFAGLSNELLKKSPFELSGGQKRRVAIAGVIAMRPEVLVLDEPTAGLDPRSRDRLMDRIREYHRVMGSTVLFVTHSMEDIARLVDRIQVMDHAHQLLCGTPREIFGHADRLQKAGLTVPQITQVFLALKKRGIPVATDLYTIEDALQELRRLKGEHLC